MKTIEKHGKRNIYIQLKAFAPFFILLFLNLLFYGNFLLEHYAADTYFSKAAGWKATAENYFSGGRWLMYAFCHLCDILHISFQMELFLSWLIAIISVSLSSLLIYHLLKDRIEKDIDIVKNGWVLLVSFMLISNVFLLEYFIFAEYSGMMCLGILFDVLGASFILKCLEQKKLSCYILGILFAILGINGHQGNFAILVLICVLCAADTFHSVKTFIRNNLIIGSAYLIPALINILEVHIGGNARTAGKNLNFAASFWKATEGLINLLKTTANFMPHKAYAICVGILGAFFLYQILRKKAWNMLLQGVYWLAIAALGIYAPLLATDVNYIDVVPRTVYIMGGAAAVLLVGLLYMDVTPRTNILLPLFVLAFLLIQYRGVLKISTSTYYANAIDRYEAQYIGTYLREYEETHNVRVTKIAFYADEQLSGFAAGLQAGYGPVNERIMSNYWAVSVALRALDGYETQMVEPSEEIYTQYFKGKNWPQINDEEFVVVGDTLHFCAY